MDTRTPASPDAVHLSLDGFEGPLDLLLDLARRQRVDLARISVVALVDQYVAAVTDSRQVNLVRAADWMVTAAWLVWLKSRLLLPADPEEAQQADQARGALTRRLVELDRVREVADWLDGQPQLGRDTFERGFVPPLEAATPVAGYLQLLEACLDVMRKCRAASDPAYRPQRLVEWTPSQAMARIRSILDQDPSGRDLLGCLPHLPAGLPDRAARLRVAIASTLAAGLELARVGRARLQQAVAFGPIAIEAAPGGSDEAVEGERLVDVAV